jgi:hypothetical protein
MTPTEHVRLHAREVERAANIVSRAQTDLERHYGWRAFWKAAQRWRRAYNAAEAARVPTPDEYLQAFGQGANI